jgi:hypothetical protein
MLCSERSLLMIDPERIRDEKELAAIREYIHTNPMKWDLDKSNPMNINAL